jgi:hypothetical protein
MALYSCGCTDNACMRSCRETEDQRKQRLEKEAEDRARAAEEADRQVHIPFRIVSILF